MRLTPKEVAAVKCAAVQVFGTAVVVRLFGSRVDDQRRGGDIDLHVELSDGLPDWRAKSRFLRLLHDGIGEREIDVIYAADIDHCTPIDRKALEQGLVL